MFLERHKSIQLLGMAELEKEGLKVLLPQSIEAALELLKKNVPDVLITDFLNFQTADLKKMLRISSIQEIPVIIHTNYPHSFINETLYEQYDCIKKSHDFTELKNKIRETVQYQPVICHRF